MFVGSEGGQIAALEALEGGGRLQYKTVKYQ